MRVRPLRFLGTEIAVGLAVSSLDVKPRAAGLEVIDHEQALLESERHLLERVPGRVPVDGEAFGSKGRPKRLEDDRGQGRLSRTRASRELKGKVRGGENSPESSGK